jgi:hypothetical protein
MPVLQQTAESKAKALQEIRETDFLNYDVLLAHHPDADNHFDGVPSKDAIALLFNSNMVNGIHALCQYPFPDDYDGPVFPMFLVEHQPMDLTGQLDTDEKLNRWEEDMYEQYSEITPDNCPPVRMARAICHSRDTKTVFIGDSVKIAGIATKKKQTEEAAAIVASIDVAIENLIAFLKSYYIDAAPCSNHDAINNMKKKAGKGEFGLPKSDRDYLLRTKQIRTVKKTHNSTKYLFCERCMKNGGVKQGTIPGPSDFRFQCVAKFIIRVMGPEGQIKGRTQLPTLEAAKGDKPKTSEVYDYRYDKKYDPVEGHVRCCLQLLEVFPHPVTCCLHHELFRNNRLLRRETNTGSSGLSVFPIDQAVVVGNAYDDVIQYIETGVRNHERNPSTVPLPGHAIDNSIPNYPFDNRRKIDIPCVKVGEVFNSRDAVYDHCESVFNAEASIAFWMMNVYEFGNQFYSEEDMCMNSWPRRECDPHIYFSGFGLPFLGYAPTGMPVVHQWRHQDIAHFDSDYPQELEQDGYIQPGISRNRSASRMPS